MRSIGKHHYPKCGISLDEYLNGCLDLAKVAAQNKTVCALRLWNLGAENGQNDAILDTIRAVFGSNWSETRTGYKVTEYVFVEFGERFEWPDETTNDEGVTFCHALRNQIGILSNGTVVPCCLDAEGRISLGNIYDVSLDDILASPRAKSIYDGFSSHTAVEKLCMSCGYAKRFKK